TVQKLRKALGDVGDLAERVVVSAEAKHLGAQVGSLSVRIMEELESYEGHLAGRQLEAADAEDEEYEPEVCEHCGEIDCERTCTPAMAEDGMFDAPEWPEPVLPEEAEAVDRMTIKQLEDVRKKYAL